MKKRTKRIFLVLASIILIAGISLALFFSAPKFLSNSYFIVQHPLQKADAIVVLGGGPRRFPHAMDLYKQDWADRLVLTGDGFNGWWHRSASQQGVDPDQLIALRSPTSTREEAIACAEQFTEMKQIETVILVTSEYHSRRAYAEFKYRMPDIKIISSPSTTPSKFAFPKRREWYAIWWYFVTRPFVGE